MSQTQQPMPEPQVNPPAPARPMSVVGRLFDISSGWAATSLNVGKVVLEQSAHTLENGAQILESISSKLSKKGSESK